MRMALHQRHAHLRPFIALDRRAIDQQERTALDD
jgi:hypothetical protein